MKTPIRIHFLTLSVFTSTGGIEKFNRAFLKSLMELSVDHRALVTASSSEDIHGNDQYFTEDQFTYFKGNKISFVLQNIWKLPSVDVLIVGHVNLAVLGVFYKILFPHRKLITICHGIEVFNPLPGLKKKLIAWSNVLLAVSSYTRDQLIRHHRGVSEKIMIFPNCIDPYLEAPVVFTKPEYLNVRYGLKKDDRILLTLTRLKRTEGYKGHDKIINVLPELIKKHPTLHYILAGKADPEELVSVKAMIDLYGLKDHVIMPGFIQQEEIIDHYLLADVFVMPSKGEGFGIVFLEAMACGLPVVAGNKDGSVDALKNGELGILVDPDDPMNVLQGIDKALNKSFDKKEIQYKVRNYFSFQEYKKRLNSILFSDN